MLMFGLEIKSHFFFSLRKNIHDSGSGYMARCMDPCLTLQFSHSVVSHSLPPHGPQHARPPCPSPAPGVHPTHVHRVGDAILPAHPLSSPSPPAFNLSQHQGLFKRLSSSHEVAKVLEFQLQHQSFQ